MQILTANINTENNQKNLFLQLLIVFILASAIVLLITTLDIKARYYVLIISVPLCLFIILNYRLTFSILIISIFINLNFFYFSISELLVLFVLLSFLLTHKYELKEFKNKILNYFGIFILSIIPSFYNLIFNVSEALPLSLHLLFFVLIFSIVSVSINNYSQINRLLNLFLTVSLINGLYLISIALITGKRVFGFSGIMYVDYVGYSVIIAFIFVMLRQNRRLISFIALSIFSLALIFTQTRSIWLVTGGTLLLIFIHLFIKNRKYNISRLKISVAFAFVVASILVFTLVISDVNKGYFERVEIKKIEQTDDPMRQSLQINSLASRYFIWSAAWEAFINNPIIGVGIYAFPFISKEYSNVEPILYETFIEKLTPHETFLTILTESGMLGFLGFMFFLISTIVFAINNYKSSKSNDELFYSEIILWLTIYTLLSMIITDAWLWGHGIVLWGILLGFSIANRKIQGFRTGKASI